MADNIRGNPAWAPSRKLAQLAVAGLTLLGALAPSIDAQADGGQPLTNPIQVVQGSLESTYGLQSVAGDSAGNFVVAWIAGGSVYAQRYTNAGALVGTQFLVATGIPGVVFEGLSVAMNAKGAFSVAWQTAAGVYLQRYASDGTAIGSNTLVSLLVLNGGTIGTSMDDAGDTVVSWSDAVIDLAIPVLTFETIYVYTEYVWASRFPASGGLPSLAKVASYGESYTAKGTTTFEGLETSVAMNGSGQFVVSWINNYSGKVMMRRYSAVGTPLWASVQVNPTDSNPSDYYYPEVAIDKKGDFAVCWYKKISGADQPSLYYRRYSNLGLALGSATTLGDSNTSSAAISYDPAGNFAVVYNTTDDPTDPHPRPVIEAQRYDSSGNASGTPITVDTGYNDGNYNDFVGVGESGIVSDGSGNFTVLWLKTFYGPELFDVIAQRFSGH
jgi:hypothetical protein